MPKEIRVYFGFALQCYVIAFKNSRHYLNQSEVKPNTMTRFSELSAGYMSMLRVLIGSLDCLCPL